MRNTLIILLLSLPFFFGACTPAELPAGEYVKWIKNPENGLHKLREIGDYRLSFQFQTDDFLDLRTKEREIHPIQLSEAQEQAPQLAHFELRMGSKDRKTPLLRNGISDMQSYQERVQYLSFEQERRIFLFSETDTLQPLLYHFERSFDLSPDVLCSLAFDHIPEGDFSLMIDDANLGLGPVYFSFHSADFQAIPALK